MAEFLVLHLNCCFPDPEFPGRHLSAACEEVEQVWWGPSPVVGSQLVKASWQDETVGYIKESEGTATAGLLSCPNPDPLRLWMIGDFEKKRRWILNVQERKKPLWN